MSLSLINILVAIIILSLVLVILVVLVENSVFGHAQNKTEFAGFAAAA